MKAEKSHMKKRNECRDGKNGARKEKNTWKRFDEEERRDEQE